jgi:hypothetical protein
MEGECATTSVRGKAYARATTVGKLQRWHRCESWWRTASAAAACCNSYSNLLLLYPIHPHSLLPLPPPPLLFLLLLPLLLPHQQAARPSPCFPNPNSSSSSLGPLAASLAPSLPPSLTTLPTISGKLLLTFNHPPSPQKSLKPKKKRKRKFFWGIPHTIVFLFL